MNARFRRVGKGFRSDGEPQKKNRRRRRRFDFSERSGRRTGVRRFEHPTGRDWKNLPLMEKRTSRGVAGILLPQGSDRRRRGFRNRKRSIRMTSFLRLLERRTVLRFQLAMKRRRRDADPRDSRRLRSGSLLLLDRCPFHSERSLGNTGNPVFPLWNPGGFSRIRKRYGAVRKNFETPLPAFVETHVRGRFRIPPKRGSGYR